jgi:hypothetical protein
MKKILVSGVIFLLFVVAVAPSINQSVVRASNDNDLVEVTTQACGINGFGNTTVKLTREQYQNLREYLVEFKARLNQTTTRAEAALLFKEAVVELDKYGLLPKGMNVDLAWKLVCGFDYELVHAGFLAKLIHKNQASLNENMNAMCLVAGSTSWAGTEFSGPLNIMLEKIFLSVTDSDLQFPTLLIFALCFSYICSTIFSNYFPLSVGQVISLDNSSGMIKTFGINGVKTWVADGFSSDFSGSFQSLRFYAHPGIIGFSGIKILYQNETHVWGMPLFLYFGSSVLVNIKYT